MRRHLRIIVVSILCAACGPSGRDPTHQDGGGDLVSDGSRADGPFGDGPVAVSESPVVTGGTFYRSHDVAADGTYPDTSYPATVSTFRLDKYEVTVGRFREFVAAAAGTQASPPAAGAGRRTLNGMANQGGWDATWNENLAADTTALVAAVKCNPIYKTWTDTPGANENRPMNCITWYEAMAFCIWDGGFLPTETESNYAASGGSEQRAYPWSSPASFLGIDDTRASYYVDATKQCFGDGVNGCALTDLVVAGTKVAGDGRWGQSNLGGNVWEWGLDWHASPFTNPCNDCANLTAGTLRVFRGGGFLQEAAFMRVALRSAVAPDFRYFGFGVRCGRAP